MSQPISTTITQAGEKRARARADVAEAVRRGESLVLFKANDLEWAFRGHEDELDELKQLEQQKIAERGERHRALEAKDALTRMTKRVLAEWDREEQEERRAKAEAVARERLGMEPA